MTRSLPSSLVRSVSLLLEDLDTPRSLTVFLMVKNGEWDQLSQLKTEPRLYLDAASYASDAAATNYLRKLPELPTSVDRRAVALQKWWEAERSCYRTNQRLEKYLDKNRLFDDRDPRLVKFFDSVRKIIAGWIGYKPPPLLEGKFGPGATFIDRGGKTTVPDKMSSNPCLTRDAIWFLPQWLGNKWGAFHAETHGEVSFVRGNRFTTVNKDCNTDRPIASEPSINMFYQLSAGSVLRERLARKPRTSYPENAGWSLDSAQEVHRQVAMDSSVTREFCTLDLSNASDTVCKTLVEILLPPDWFELLSMLRSSHSLVDDHWVLLEKFSSMGNGFTFELETIIFAAISCAVVRKNGGIGKLGLDVFVFGDDIIVPNGDAIEVKSALSLLGFTLNDAKSFYEDEPFRESCGGDYFMGKPVRSFFLKLLPSSPSEGISHSNGILDLMRRLSVSGKRIRTRAWFSTLDELPSEVRRCRGPKALGDIVLWDSPDRWTIRWRGGIRYIRCFRAAKKRVVPFSLFDSRIVLACATYGTGNNGTPERGVYQRVEGVIPRDAVLSYKVGWTAFS